MKKTEKTRLTREHNEIFDISSKRDLKIFFKTLRDSPKPNEALQNAARRYNELVNSPLPKIRKYNPTVNIAPHTKPYGPFQ